MKIMKLIIAAKEIPTGSTVTKRNGEVEYIIRDNIDVYQIDGKKIEIGPNKKEVRFLVTQGSIHIIPWDTELVWITTLSNLHTFINLLELGTPQ